MTARALLRGRCVVSRYAAVSDSAGGEVWTWSTVADEVPCHLDYPAGSERDSDSDVLRAVRRRVLFVPSTADITGRDRVSVDDVTFEVTHVGGRTRSAVLEVDLAEVTP